MLRQLLAVAFLTLAGMAAKAADDPAVTVVKGRFDEVRESLVAAIEGRGLVISYTAHVGAMLDRTGKDLGASTRVFDQAESLEFCSARVSRRMMEADPANIVYCPFAIAIYTLPGKPEAVHLAYRRSPPALNAVEELLKGIVADAKP
jgi:uncharacterized protein (DUF302 family)